MPKRRRPRFLLTLAPEPPEGGSADDENEKGTSEAPKSPQEPGDGDGDRLGDKGIQALQAEREARKAAQKAARDAQAALDAERNAHAATVKAAEASKVEALRYKAADQTGLPLNLAGRLQGATLEELKADATSLLESIKPGFVAPVDPSQGKDQGEKTGGTVEAGRDLYDRLHKKNRTGKEKN